MNGIDDVKKTIQGINENPTVILPTLKKETEQELREALKFILKYYNIKNISVDNFTEEQIYYQIDMFNKKNMMEIEKLQAKIDENIERVKDGEMEEESEENEEENEENESEEKKEDNSYLDEELDMDAFNKAMDDMEGEEFQKQMEDIENIDTDEEEEENEEESSKSHEGDEDEENEFGVNVKEAPKTEFEKEQELIKNKINKLEAEKMKDKHWSLLGEVRAEDRPTNSLVDMEIDYQNANRPPPEMTKEQTQSLEDMIRRRIKEQSWDDVVRKTLIDKKEKKEIELDSEKSKLGLADIYEQKYAKEIYNFDSKDEVLNEQKKQIMKQFNGVMAILNKLTNAYGN